MHGAILNAEVSLGDNVIINTRADVEHGVRIGDHTHISTGAVVNGDCTIGSNVFIGSQATVRNGVEICDNVLIGAASYVSESIVLPGIYVGNPCKLLAAHA